MAKPKQKNHEPLSRSPGRSRFNIPRKDTPQIDGSYLERLFADFQQQSAEQEDSSSPLGITPVDSNSISKNIVVLTPVTTAAHNDLEFEEKLSPVEQTAPSLPQSDTNVSTTNTKGEFPSNKHFTPPLPSVRNKTLPLDNESFSSVQIKSQSVWVTDQSGEEYLRKVAKTLRLAAGELSVLRVMMRLCRERSADTCYIKIPQLMVEANLSDRQTQRILKNLLAFELIEKLADYSNIDRLGTLFRLNLS